MAKKIAVIVRERQHEALRMALGITLLDDIIDVYILDRKIEENEANTMNLEMMKEMKINIFTNCRENNDMFYVPTEDIAKRILEYDLILPY
jgi:aspartokinase